MLKTYIGSSRERIYTGSNQERMFDVTYIVRMAQKTTKKAENLAAPTSLKTVCTLKCCGGVISTRGDCFVNRHDIIEIVLWV